MDKYYYCQSHEANLKFLLLCDKIKSHPKIDIFHLWNIPKSEGPKSTFEKLKEKVPFDKEEYETMNFSNIRQLNQAMIDLIEDDESTDPNITGLPISDDE